ncbi:hypothetical protein ACG3SL_09785 [Sphingomonas sp. CJ20]
MRQTILTLAGIVALAFGVLFLLQGLGVVRWPSSSFMIDSRTWVVRGGSLAVLGAILLVAARRYRASGSHGQPGSGA